MKIKPLHPSKIVAGTIIATIVVGSASIAFAEDTISAGADVHVSGQTEGHASSTHPLREMRRENHELRASTTEEIRRMREEGSSTLEARHELRASTTEQIKENRAEAKIEFKEKLDTRRQQNIIKVIANRIKAHTEIITHQQKRVAQVSSISAQIKAAGKDTSAADTKLADASAKLTIAVTDLASVRANASTTVTSTDPATKLQQVKSLFDTVNADIKTAHQDIADAISSLKALGTVTLHVEEHESASTTTSTQ